MRALDREILRLALPALGALLVEPLVSVVDTAFVGRLGARPLAALGITTALLGLFFVVFNFLAYATTPRIAYALGKGDRQEALKRASEALWLSLGLGGLAALLLLVLAPFLVGLMGGGAVYREALGYLRLRALSGPAILLTTAAHGIYRGFQDTRTPFLVSLAANLANALLDPVLIFPLGMGLNGAALASVLAQSLGAGWFLHRLVRLGAWRPFPGLAALAPYLRVGGEMLLRTASLVGAIAVAAAAAARIGVVAVAAHQILWQVWLLLAMALDALAIAAQALVARLRGEDPGAARAASDRLLALGLWAGLALALLLLPGRAWVPAFFTPDPAVGAAVRSVWPVVVLATPVNALVFVWDGVFMAAERFRFLAVTTFLASLLGSLWFLAVPPLGLGLAALWGGMLAMNLVRGAFQAWGYAKRKLAP